MALKRKINKTEFDNLPEALKTEYVADGMDFVLQVDGFDDPAELKRAKDREKQRADEAAATAKKALEDLATMRKQLEDDGTLSARKKGDIEALEKSWQAKLDTALTEGKAATQKLQGSVRNMLLTGTAKSLAAEISSAPSLMLPHLLSRLDVDFTGDEPVLRVLGLDGKPSALTVEELGKEFVANADFASIIVGSKASGGGAAGGKQGSGGATKKLSEMTESERVAFNKRDPQGFRKAAEADKPAEAVKL